MLTEDTKNTHKYRQRKTHLFMRMLDVCCESLVLNAYAHDSCENQSLIERGACCPRIFGASDVHERFLVGKRIDLAGFTRLVIIFQTSHKDGRTLEIMKTQSVRLCNFN